jgi:sortase A
MKSNRVNSKWVVTVIILLAAAIILHSLWLPSKAWLSEQLIYHSWQQTKLNQKAVKPWPWADTVPFAKLSIERLNRSLILLKGADPTSLAFSAGAMHQFSTFDKHSPIVIAGHRDTHFSFIEEVKMKDIISLSDQYGRNHLYEVDELNIVDSEHSELIIEPLTNDLLLVTCYPFNALDAGGSLRYVVKARLL